MQYVMLEKLKRLEENHTAMISDRMKDEFSLASLKVLSGDVYSLEILLNLMPYVDYLLKKAGSLARIKRSYVEG